MKQNNDVEDPSDSKKSRRRIESREDADSALPVEDESAKSTLKKRNRLVWTPMLHKRFEDAVAHLGIENAVPRTILRLMNVEGLRLENVSSHLQKYRLCMKRKHPQNLNDSGSSGRTSTRFPMQIPMPYDRPSMEDDDLTPLELGSVFMNTKSEPHRNPVDDVNRASENTFSSLRRSQPPRFVRRMESAMRLRGEKYRINCVEKEEVSATVKQSGRRLVWTAQLHKRFVDAVAHVGIKNAVPKTILQLMNVEGLTGENVSSHLQKYRLYLKGNQQ